MSLVDKELPLGYYRLPYLESDGTNYIDTGVKGHAGLYGEGKMSYNEIPSDGTFCGARKDRSHRTYLLHYFQSVCLGYMDYHQLGVKAVVGKIYEFKTDLQVGHQTLIWNGELIGERFIEDVANNNLNLYIFALNDEANGVARPTYFIKARMYYLKIWFEGVLVRDYIPCVNTSFQRGVYDLVNNKFTPLTYV